MDDLTYGSRDKRGNWSPKDPIEVGPLLDRPWSLLKVIRWLPGYFLPWNVMFLGLGAALWTWATPARETLQTLSLDWIAFLLLRNAAIVLVVFGCLELWLYVRRTQGNRFKYNGAFPADRPSDVFWFKSQNIDNILRTFLSGIPIWTGYEVLMLWAWANGIGPWVALGDHPVWLLCFGLVLPLVHEVHFFLIHRLIHLPPLYRLVHSVHHNSVNPSPWSSLSMHPVEHLLYWSDVLIHLVLPSHPLLVLYHLQIGGTGAVIGHVGFDRIELGKDDAIGTHAYAHYLHHKYFEVNYADGSLPLDKWLGTWHDGSAEAQQKMVDRFSRKKQAQSRV